MHPFLLGLSNGAQCLAYCVPVLIPYLLGRGEGVKGNFTVIVRFLVGRLFGYLAFGLAVWAVSRPVLQVLGYEDLILGSSFLILAPLLVFYGFFPEKCACPVTRLGALFKWISGLSPSLIPVIAGLATGLSFCPPFLLATAGAAEKGSLPGTLFFFLSFFLGTSVFFVPVPLLGFLGGRRGLKIVGRMAAGLMGIYYFYCGIIMITGGIDTP
jgi:hypothetical protein